MRGERPPGCDPPRHPARDPNMDRPRGLGKGLRRDLRRGHVHIDIPVETVYIAATATAATAAVAAVVAAVVAVVATATAAVSVVAVVAAAAVVAVGAVVAAGTIINIVTITSITVVPTTISIIHPVVIRVMSAYRSVRLCQPVRTLHFNPDLLVKPLDHRCWWRCTGSPHSDIMREPYFIRIRQHSVHRYRGPSKILYFICFYQMKQSICTYLS